MRRTTRVLAGALLTTGLGLSGCSFGSDEPATDGTGVPAVFDEEEVGSPDRVDGGEEDADGIDRGTGGIDEDDNTGIDDDTGEDDAGSVDGGAGTGGTSDIG
ncbi:hypothetical protein E9549_20315 [Blastococcus sp. MG754426]|uniref:hypothetical protein n=1 Tax=unclassified Blastococcus TaxID=2619396 RepID=UPI001EEFDCA2|nr:MULTISPECIES: hypothetical protein [unclassified Blastococcus]MCF6509718.1 hypothetical protein [Blastococcus sp. MG754426]MCF6514112.1 hypothetical protein [Blastococcus sp. MG754427]MCF6737204.1 hypothetical protein [Blastococcus sp. KM273129]